MQNCRKMEEFQFEFEFKIHFLDVTHLAYGNGIAYRLKLENKVFKGLKSIELK